MFIDYGLGYIKLPRSIVYQLAKTPELLTLYVYLSSKASFESREIIFNGFKVPLEPGELVTGRKALSSELGIEEQPIRTQISKLISFSLLRKVTSKSTNRYTVLSVDYIREAKEAESSKQPTSNQPPDQLATDQQPASNQPATTKKELNNDKNDNNDNKPKQRKRKKKKIDFELSPEKQAAFNDWYIDFPRKNQRAKAEEAWDEVFPDRGSLEKFKLLLQEDLPDFLARDIDKVPLPASWLRSRWKDMPENMPDANPGEKNAAFLAEFIHDLKEGFKAYQDNIERSQFERLAIYVSTIISEAGKLDHLKVDFIDRVGNICKDQVEQIKEDFKARDIFETKHLAAIRVAVDLAREVG